MTAFAGDLRQVGDGDHLQVIRQAFHDLPDFVGYLARYPCIYLIKNNSRQSGVLGDDGFNGQHQPGKLTAGCHLAHFGKCMAFVGVEKKPDLIKPIIPQTPRWLAECHVPLDKIMLFS